MKIVSDDSLVNMSSDDKGGEECLFKIVIISDSAVGKTNLLSRYARNEFNPRSKATIGNRQQGSQGSDLGYPRPRVIPCCHLRLLQWFRWCSHLSMISPAQPNFESVGCWLDELKTHCDTTVAMILVGSKY